MLRKYFQVFLPFGLPWLPPCAVCDRLAPIDDGADDTIRQMLNPMNRKAPDAVS